MTPESLDRLIDQFNARVVEATSLFGPERVNWREVWAIAKEIQLAFKETQYPTRQLQDQAWVRFNDLRNKASAKANDERAHLRTVSESHRGEIMREARAGWYSPFTDVIFFFDPTTISDMKEKGSRLTRARKMLSERKTEMLGEHKDECFKYIKEVHETHEAFWGRRRELMSSRQDERDTRRQERRATEIEKRTANVQANRDRLQRAKAALDRAQDNAEDVRSKRDSARSAIWEARFGEWLDQAEAKCQSIRQSIQRTEEWIAEDERRLNDLYRN